MAFFSEIYQASLRPIRAGEPLPDESNFFNYPEPTPQPQPYFPYFAPPDSAYSYAPPEQLLPPPLPFPPPLPPLAPLGYYSSEMDGPISIQAPPNTQNETPPDTNMQPVYMVALIALLALVLLVTAALFVWVVGRRMHITGRTPADEGLQ
ncbi:uncharacterized protein LOC144100399 [Amblyomma americanum]